MTRKERIKHLRSTEYFMELVSEIKDWFERRNIDTGYTDTNVGNFAFYIKNKIIKELENKELE